MVKISDAAATKAKEILAAEGKDSWGLRVYAAEGGCCGPSYGMDLDERSADGDQVIEKNGLKVFIDPATFQKLSGMEIDFVDDPDQGSGFVIIGGQSACGSGCSSCG